MNARNAALTAVLATVVASLQACSSSPQVFNWDPSPPGDKASPDKADAGALGEDSLDANVDASHPSIPGPEDGGSCSSSRKSCGGACVSLQDTLFGCTASGCNPCSVPNATSLCAAGACTIGVCSSNRGDCDGRVDTGCEVDMASAHDHCGTCATACGPTQVCNKGVCASTCGAGTSSCGGSCVAVASDPANCGSCGKVCPGAVNGSAVCSNQICGVTCNGGYHSCGGQCVSTTSVSSCGTSCTPCAAPANGAATCNGSTCDFTCNAGFQRSGAGCVMIPPPRPDSGTPGGACDVSGNRALLYYQLALTALAGNYRPCPPACGVTECCYESIVCLPSEP